MDRQLARTILEMFVFAGLPILALGMIGGALIAGWRPF